MSKKKEKRISKKVKEALQTIAEHVIVPGDGRPLDDTMVTGYLAKAALDYHIEDDNPDELYCFCYYYMSLIDMVLREGKAEK